MAREYPYVREYYLHLHELPPLQHYHYDLPHDANANTAQIVYEMTSGPSAGAGAGEGAGAHDPATPHQMPEASHDHSDAMKRKSHHFLENFDMATCDSLSSPMSQVTPSHMPRPARSTRKHSLSSYVGGSTYDDDGGDDSRSTRTLPEKKQNHSEVEKRRRDKMNTYISELSSMIPMCGAMSRKLDKLTVLRMAVQHMRTIRGSLNACPLTARPRPAFLPERELNQLILEAAKDCFLFVVGCDRGRLLYVSESVSTVLNYEKSELLGQSLFDILHPKDVAKVKEQLSSSDLSPRERLIDAKTMLPLKAEVCTGASRFCTGARRSFFCRIKCKAISENSARQIKEESEPVAILHKKQPEKKYRVVQCTGYLKSWTPAEMCDSLSGATTDNSSTSEVGDEGELHTLSCLVTVGRALADLVPELEKQELPTRYIQFVSRHTTDGKFLFVDQRVTLALGFLPQELLGTSLYEYVPPPELGAVAQTHKDALLRRNALQTPPYYFRRKDGSHARLQTHFKPFRNPWTKDIEYLVANNTVLSETQTPPSGPDHGAYDVFKQKADAEMQQLIDSQVESHKIGSAIAEEAFRRSSPEFPPEIFTDLIHDPFLNQQPSLVDNILGESSMQLMDGGSEGTTERESGEVSGGSTTAPLSGDVEAALAVIMSLLEADAGLGGPVNFSGLPWPLP